MAHESFEDAAIAALMNELLRQHQGRPRGAAGHRPDLSWRALHALGEQGGWPLTMFLTPDARAVLGRHLFPAEAALRPAGLPQVLRADRRALWRDERDKVANNAARAAASALAAARGARSRRARCTGELARPLAGSVAGDRSTRRTAASTARRNSRNAPLLELLWRHWLRTGDRPARRRPHTLAQHAARAASTIISAAASPATRSTPLARAAFREDALRQCPAARAAGLGLCRETGEPTVPRANRRNGRLARARDACAGGRASPPASMPTATARRDKFYVWSCGRDDGGTRPRHAGLFSPTTTLATAGNWEGETILNRLGAFAAERGSRAAGAAARRAAGTRAPRIRPGRDDKVLADWNGLMIAALAEAAGLVVGRPDWLELLASLYRSSPNHMTATAASAIPGERAGSHARPRRATMPT